MPEHTHDIHPLNLSAPSPDFRHQIQDNIVEPGPPDVNHIGYTYQRFWENLRHDNVPNTLDDRVASKVEVGKGINMHLTLSTAKRQAVNHIRRLPSPPPASTDPYLDVNDVFPRLQPPTPRTSPISPLSQMDNQQHTVHTANEAIE